MTDKQIENELHLFQNRFINNDKIWLFIQNTLDYIDRLKAENERLTNTAYNVGVKVAEETRKETAKDILELIKQNTFNLGKALYAQTIDDDCDVVSLLGLQRDIKKEYGVEVEE